MNFLKERSEYLAKLDINIQVKVINLENKLLCRDSELISYIVFSASDVRSLSEMMFLCLTMVGHNQKQQHKRMQHANYEAR